MTTAGTGPEVWAGIDALVFDVLGTVVDEQGSIVAEVAGALAAAGASSGQAAELTDAWTRRLSARTAAVSSGETPWEPGGDLWRAALDEAVVATGLGQLPAAVLASLARAGHRLRAWPDSAPALRALAASRTVVALSNASLAQLTGMSAAGGLAWHCVLSGELVRTYKPHPDVYRLALDVLGADPRRTMMVAAHPWDLRAAAGHGMRTAYVPRPGEGNPEPGDHFDVYARDLGDLAEQASRAGQASHSGHVNQSGWAS
jgi:2-haloacid dehalogenase